MPPTRNINAPLNYAHNARAIAGDSSLFTIGINFVSGSTVIPTLVSQLTNSPVLIGLMAGLPSGAWLLPQIFIAAWVAHRRRKQPIVALAAFISRLSFFIMGIAVGLFSITRPALALAALLLFQVLFYIGDAIASVPWFDLLAKSIPPRRRGRVLGTSQVIGGIGGIFVGIAVRYILGPTSPWHYPLNYTVLFMATGIVMMGATFCLSQIREEPTESPSVAPPKMVQLLHSLPNLIRTDRAFGRMLLTRLIAGFISIASAFYVIYAIKVLGLSTAVTGLFLSAQVAGALLAGLMMSTLQDHYGVLVYMRVAVACATLPPILALVIGLMRPLLGSAIIYPYLLVFCLLGFYFNSIGWPFFAWILEHAQENKRPLYIGVSNTLGALTMIAPPLGGWLAETLGYPSVFITSLLFAILALGLTFTLPHPGTAHSNEAPSIPAAT
jgi:MFS family permease